MFERTNALDEVLHRSRPSFWSLLLQHPYQTLARWLYKRRAIWLKSRLYIARSQERQLAQHQLDIVCVSDTHNTQSEIPDGDLFIHAGDLTQGGTVEELQAALNWIDDLPHQHKVVIAGNHDMCLDRSMYQAVGRPKLLKWGSITYLQDTSVDLMFKGGRKISIYGTPHTRKHGSWGFQFPKGLDHFTHTVPEATDILISHSPPRFHLDANALGDDNLLAEAKRIRPMVHVFGQVHDGYGSDVLAWDAFQLCYEDICRNSGGVWCLVKLLYLFFSSSAVWYPGAKNWTVTVNASAVGGLRDNLRREPITLSI